MYHITMSIENDLFLKFRPDLKKLLDYGFVKTKNSYVIEKLFMNNEFKAVITVSKNFAISGTVYDQENNDEFLPLRIEHHEGAFVGEVKYAYIAVLTDIRNKCFYENLVISNQGNRIVDLIREKYNNKPEFLWKDSPSTCVFRNPESSKWYGIIMQIPRSKLGEPSEKTVEVMNVKLDKNKIPELHKKDGFYPAYHMNKKYWITISLDETLSDNEIMQHIEESHSYTVKKKK